MTTVTGIQGLRGAGQFDKDHRPTNYRTAFTMLEPNGNAPLQALLAFAASESSDDPVFNNFRDELPDRVMVVATGDATQSPTIDLTASPENTFAIKNALVTNARTGEVMYATADTTGTTLNVIRNIGGAPAAAPDINAGDSLFVSGYAAPEGGELGSSVTFDAVVSTNQCQIFRTPFDYTRTLDHTYLRTGNKRTEMQIKALKLHMSDIERAMFFGKMHTENAGTNQETRFSGGFTNMVTGVTDLDADFNGDGSLSEDQFDQLLFDTVFAYGSKEKIVFGGATSCRNLHIFAKNRWQPIAVEGTYGVNFIRYRTYTGDILVHLHPQFRQIPGMDSALIFIDFPYLRYRYLDSSDTQLLSNRQNPGKDGTTDEFLSECGLELLQDKVHHYVKNWNTVPATP